MQESRGFTTAEDIKSDAPESFTSILTGRTFQIRKLFPAQLAASGILSIPLAALQSAAAKQADGKELDEYEIAQLELYINAIVCMGVTSVKVVDRPESECAPDEVSIDSLELDKVALSEAIAKKSGWHNIAAESASVVNTVREGESFREAESPDRGGGEA